MRRGQSGHGRRRGLTTPDDRASGARHRVVVVGGGFGGLQAVRKLRHAPVDITLIDRRNFHLFQPLVYQVATGALSPGEIASPLRGIFKRDRNVRVLLGEVTGFDLARRRVLLDRLPSGDERRAISYDSLIVAAGSSYSYFGHDEWRPRAPDVKSLESALEVRRRILTAFEAGEVEPDPDRRAAWLTFVVVGGGPTGVELAGQIAEIAQDTLRRDFRTIDTRAAADPARRDGRARPARVPASPIRTGSAGAGGARGDAARWTEGRQHRRGVGHDHGWGGGGRAPAGTDHRLGRRRCRLRARHRARPPRPAPSSTAWAEWRSAPT